MKRLATVLCFALLGCVAFIPDYGQNKVIDKIDPAPLIVNTSHYGTVCATLRGVVSGELLLWTYIDVFLGGEAEDIFITPSAVGTTYAYRGVKDAHMKLLVGLGTHYLTVKTPTLGPIVKSMKVVSCQ